MTDKVDGTSKQSEALVGDLDFFTVSTTSNIASDGAIGDADQDLFDKFVEVISQKGQPVLMSAVDSNAFNFAVEHNSLWTESGADDAKAETLKTVLEAIPGAGTVTVLYSASLPPVPAP